MKFIMPSLNLFFERWKWNEEFRVYVSNKGNFKNERKENLGIKINSGGYVAVRTCRGYRYAHRLVMYTWKPIPDRESMTVDHLNHNKRLNWVTNLEWVTQKENMRRAEKDYLPDAPAKKKVKLKTKVNKNSNNNKPYDTAMNERHYNRSIKRQGNVTYELTLNLNELLSYFRLMDARIKQEYTNSKYLNKKKRETILTIVNNRRRVSPSGSYFNLFGVKVEVKNDNKFILRESDERMLSLIRLKYKTAVIERV